MIRRPPRSTRTDTLFPYTTLFRSADLRAHPRVRTQSKLGQIVQGSDPLSDGPNDECTVGAGIHFQPRARKRESRALGIWRQWEPSAGTCDHIKSVIVDRAREGSRAEDRLGILPDSIRSDERCVGQGVVSRCKSWWLPVN